jgi:hypothetical protein
MNALDPAHWTLNSCFGVFGTVSSPHENRYKTGRTGAISAQVREKNHVGIFRNARTRCTVLDPKLMFWCVSDRFITAQKSMQTGRTDLISAQFFATSAPDPPATHAPDPLYWTLNSCFGVFRTVLSPHRNRCKRAELVQVVHMFVQRCHVGIFHNEHTRSNRLDPKLMFWCVWDRFINAQKMMQNGPNLSN